MSIVSDQDFGELHFDGVWKGICEMVFMGRRLEVELVVQTFDAAPISEVQRLAYREFNLNKGSISSLVEEAVLTITSVGLKNIESALMLTKLMSRLLGFVRLMTCRA